MKKVTYAWLPSTKNMLVKSSRVTVVAVRVSDKSGEIFAFPTLKAAKEFTRLCDKNGIEWALCRTKGKKIPS